MRFKTPSFAKQVWKTSSVEELNNKQFFNHDDIWTLLEALNENLKCRSLYVDIKLFGGAAICIALGPEARESTRDLDAIYNHRGEVEDIVNDIALDLGITPDWLEWLAKPLRGAHETFQHIYTFSNLTVYTASPDYLLVLKLRAARPHDLVDIRHIWTYLGCPDAGRVKELWVRQFPSKAFPENTFKEATELS